MTLWLILTLMTSIAAVLVATPFIRRYERMHGKASAAMAVYRDQLSEVERDAKEGAIDDGQAETARIEIKRRMLDADQGDGLSPALSPRERVFAAASVAGIVVLGSVGLYALTGGPDLPSATASRPPEPMQSPAAALLRPAPEGPRAQQSGLPPVDELIQRLVARLQQNPRDAEGWRMLGWSYSGTEHFSEAANAYANAIEINPANLDFRNARVEALVKAAGGRLTAEAAAANEETLKLDPKNVHARYFAGLAKDQAGDKSAAVREWTEVLRDADPKEAWVSELQQRLNAAGKELGMTTSAPLQSTRGAASRVSQIDAAANRPAAVGSIDRGPNPDIARKAEAMNADERNAMIRAMVDGLATRLEQSPRDVDGWIKLMRSRTVLGESQMAKSARDRAMEIFRDSASEREQIIAAARQLGL